MTLQTLHPTQFDHGRILTQTPSFTIGPPSPACSSVLALTRLVAPKGADLLLDGIRNGLFISQTETPNTIQNEQGMRSLRRAPKITPEDRHINWNTWSAEEIMRRHNVIGPLWNTASSERNGITRAKRVIWVSGFSRTMVSPGLSLKPGTFIDKQFQDPEVWRLSVTTCDGALLRIDEAKVEGYGTQDARQAVRRAGMLRGGLDILK